LASVEGFLGQRLDEFLEAVAADTPAPGGGSVAAVVVAMAAGLTAMAARFSVGRWDDAQGVAARADGNALARAAEVPLTIAREASEVAALAALVASRGNPNLRGDAVAAALLAAAGGRSAANLVEINLAASAEDERRRRAREYVTSAEASVREALGAGP
jgi:formiminotetrahydrofolate cyclodeaminase